MPRNNGQGNLVEIMLMMRQTVSIQFTYVVIYP